MKYVSLVIFVAALAWTWSVIHSEASVPFETHSAIQEQLASHIIEKIKAQRPNATDILVEKMWTEILSPDKLKAHFAYSFKENLESGAAISKITGEGMLVHEGEDAEGRPRWVFTKGPASSNAIQFDDTTVITGSPNGSPDMPTEDHQ